MLYILLLLFCFDKVMTEYSIKHGDIPSYLYHRFDNIKENVFPHSLEIIVSFSRITGTLIYSMDRNGNQLIVSLTDALIPTLCIEFSTQITCLSLIKLCGCKRCRYVKLHLIIQMRDSMYIQCNNGPTEIINYERSLKLNEAYPIPYTRNGTGNGSKNQAKLWLVNTPQYGNVYPNSEQFAGCIFDVRYNNNPIDFTNVSDNINRKCIAICSPGICNEGVCFETYNSSPVCNCTSTFLNGDYCNKSMVPVNAKSTDQSFVFDMFKLSWLSWSPQLMKLNSDKITLQVTSENKKLIFNYQYRNIYHLTTEDVLATNYDGNSKYIMVVYFQESRIDVVLTNNGSTHRSSIATNQDLRREIFTDMELRSGKGVIDVVYKTSPQEYRWRKVEFIKPLNLGEDATTYLTNTKGIWLSTVINNRGGNYNIFFICLTLPFALLSIMLVVMFFWHKSRIKHYKRINTRGPEL